MHAGWWTHNNWHYYLHQLCNLCTTSDPTKTVKLKIVYSQPSANSVKQIVLHQTYIIGNAESMLPWKMKIQSLFIVSVVILRQQKEKKNMIHSVLIIAGNSDHIQALKKNHITVSLKYPIQLQFCWRNNTNLKCVYYLEKNWLWQLVVCAQLHEIVLGQHFEK